MGKKCQLAEIKENDPSASAVHAGVNRCRLPTVGINGQMGRTI